MCSETIEKKARLGLKEELMMKLHQKVSKKGDSVKTAAHKGQHCQISYCQLPKKEKEDLKPGGVYKSDPVHVYGVYQDRFITLPVFP